MQYGISFHRSMHMAACGCVQVHSSRGRKKRDGKTHILPSLQIIFLQKIPTVSQRQNSSSPSNSQSTARRCVVLCSLDQRFGLVSPPEWSWTGTKFLFGHSQPLVGETEGSSCLSECFFFFSSYFSETWFPIYSERSWLRKTYLYSSSPPGLCEDPSTSCPLTL